MADVGGNALYLVEMLCLLGFCFFAVKYAWSYARHKRSALYPELAIVDEKQSGEIFNAARGRDELMGSTCIYFAIGCLLFIIVPGLLCRVLSLDSPLVKPAIRFLLLTVVCAAAPLASYVVRHRRISLFIRMEFNRRGVPMCVACGHCLVGASTSVCGECGASHDAAICWTCLGKGSLWRAHVLATGIAITGVWAILTAYQAYLADAGVIKPEIQPNLLLLGAPVGLGGLGVLLLYFKGGRAKPCHACKGTGRVDTQIAFALGSERI